MELAIQVAARSKLEAIEPTIDDTLGCLQDRLNALPPHQLVAVVEAVNRALAPLGEEQTPPVITAFTGGQSFSPEERIETAVELLQRSFVRRRTLIADALSTSQVAALLNTSRQTPHDRVASGTLLAVMDRGTLRFPPWQFDPDGEDGVVTGLPTVIRALAVSPMARASWLTRPNAMLDGETPLAQLRAGQVQRVLALAHGVGLA